MRFDPLLPASSHLAGAGAVELLAAALEPGGVVVERATVRSIHHKPGRSMAVVYDATVCADGVASNGAGPDRAGDRRRDVLLVAWTGTKQPPEGTAIVAAGDLRVAVWRFPHDPWLPGLAPAVHRRRVRELLDRLGAFPGQVGIYTRSYRPARRAVVEVSIDGGSPSATGRLLYLKLLKGDGAVQLADVHRQLAGAVPVPGVFGVAERQGIVAFEALSGPTLRQALIAGAAPPPEAIVAFQRQLADVALDSAAKPQRFANPDRHVVLLKSLLPHQAPRIDAIAARARYTPNGPRVTVHGDLHDGQLLVDDRSVTGVLDVDGSGSGAFVDDCANMIAHLEALAYIQPEAADRIHAYAEDLAAAYRPELIDPDVLPRAVASAWLGLATGPYRAQDPDWQDGTARRLDRAAQWLARAA